MISKRKVRASETIFKKILEILALLDYFVLPIVLALAQLKAQYSYDQKIFVIKMLQWSDCGSQCCKFLLHTGSGLDNQMPNNIMERQTL